MSMQLSRIERERAVLEDRVMRAEGDRDRERGEKEREKTRREQAEAQCQGLQRRVQELESQLAGALNNVMGSGNNSGGFGAPNPDNNGFVSASQRLAMDRKRLGMDGNNPNMNSGGQDYESSGNPNNTTSFGRPGPRKFVPPYKQPAGQQNQQNGGQGNQWNVAGSVQGGNLGNAPPFVRKALGGAPSGPQGNSGRNTGGMTSNNQGNANANADNIAGIPLDQDGKLPGRLAACEPNLVELIMFEMLDRSPGVRWDDIAGLEFAKKNVVEVVVWPLQRPDLVTGLRGPPKGMLLFGPPGTGKTLIGKAIATESEAHFFSISASSLTSKWHGQGEKLVRALFAVAAYYEPAVIFIDEIDSLLSQRQDAEFEASRRIKTELLIQLDGAASSTPCMTWRVRV